MKELIDFAQFLKSKKEEFTHMQVRDSAEYVRKLRIEEAMRVKSGKRFKFLDNPNYERLSINAIEIKKMLTVLIQKLRSDR